jgi:serine/threonine protein kinase
MIKEFKHIVKLGHPNVVRTYKMYIDVRGNFSNGTELYVIMEYVEGKEMFEVIN